MKQLVGFHDLTDESEIDGVVEELMTALGQESAEPDTEIEKHSPGGVTHDQEEHGNWSDGSGDTSTPDDGASPDPVAAGGQAAPDPSGDSGGEDAPLLGPADVPGEDEAFVSGVREQYLAQAGPQIAYVAENAGLEQMSIEGERRGIDTMGMYGIWEGDTFQGYGKDRTQWQAGVLAEMQAEQAAANGKEPEANKQAVLMMGLPGAGKSFLIKNELNEIIDTRDFLTINADDVKQKLIYDDTPPQIEGVAGDELASMVHEESSSMRKYWEKSAMAKGTNMILDVTGANKDKTIKVLEGLKAQGYDIIGVHADVSVAEAQASALRRAASGGSDGNLGRIVPAGFIDSMASDEYPGSDVVDLNFDDYLPHLNDAHWFRTFPLNVERDKSEQKPTQLLWSTTG